MTQAVNVPGVGTLNFPDGMSQQDMAAAIQKNFPQIHNQQQVKQWATDAKTPSAFESLAIPVGAALSDTGRSIGHLANLIGASQSPGMLPAAMAANAADQANTDKQEQPARDYAAEQNPKRYYGLYAPTSILSMAPLGEGVGGLAAKATAPLSASANIAPRVAGFLARSGATGAGYGAQMPGNTVSNIATGAALGPLGEGAIKGIGLAGKVASKTGGGIADLTRQMVNPAQEAKNTVRKIVQESATGTPTLTPSPIPGVNLTAGGQSMNPGLQGLERVVRSRNVGGLGTEDVAQSIQRQNNSVIRGRFGQIASINTPLQKASTDAADALNEAKDARSSQSTELWNAVPESTKFNMAAASSASDKYINGLSEAEKGTIEPYLGKYTNVFKRIVSKYADNNDLANTNPDVIAPFKEFKGLRSVLGTAIRTAGKDGDRDATRLLRGLDETLLTSAGNENAFIGLPEQTGNIALDSANAKLARMNGVVNAKDLGDAYNNARFFTSDTHNKYFTKDVQGFLKQDPARMLDSVTKTPENMKAYLNAASQAPDGGAKATQALRDYLLSKGIDSASMSARGGAEKFLNGQTLQDWLHQNQGVLSHVFSGDELNHMNQLAEASYRNIATEAATPRVGSNTLEKFMGNQNLPGVPGKFGAAANSIRDMLVGRYRGQTEKLLRDTLMDPQNKGLQEMLDQPMTQENMNKLIQLMNKTPALKAKIPLLFNAALHTPSTAATRLLAQPAQQGAP